MGLSSLGAHRHHGADLDAVLQWTRNASLSAGYKDAASHLHGGGWRGDGNVGCASNDIHRYASGGYGHGAATDGHLSSHGNPIAADSDRGPADRDAGTHAHAAPTGG